ncbi:MAG: hypothetical protein KY468_17405 [Armatimonadetes bacterium]|nr:hypothetical protein [Armatimonadota bacterium]
MPLLLATRQGLCLAEGDHVTPLQENADFMALARSLSNPTVYYAAERGGQVYRSTDSARTWEAVGRIEGYTELSSLAIDPHDPAQLWAGMEPSALFKSEDGGETWTEDPAIRQMAEDEEWSVPWSDAKGHVRVIALDPNDPRRIYLAIEVGGVVRSEDGGETWENVHGGIHDDVHAVAVNPKEPNVLYAATRHRFGRSEDYGRTWRQIDAFEGQGYSRPLAVNPENPLQVFTAAATTGPGGFSRPDVGAECGIYRSNDGGLSWTHLTNGIPARFKPYVDAMDVNPSKPEHVALADSDGAVYESRDGGESWSRTAQAPPVRRMLVVPEG